MKIIKIRDNHPRATGENFREVKVEKEYSNCYLLNEHIMYYILKSQIEIKL